MRSNIAASKRHAAPWNVPLLLILTLLALQFSRASATQTLPIKHMNEANKQIHWPGDTWLILKKEDGCEVVTEESQIGPSAIKFNTEQPTAMFDGHHWWLTALKARCERAKQLSESISPAHLRLNLSSREMR